MNRTRRCTRPLWIVNSARDQSPSFAAPLFSNTCTKYCPLGFGLSLDPHDHMVCPSLFVVNPSAMGFHDHLNLMANQNQRRNHQYVILVAMMGDGETNKKKTAGNTAIFGGGCRLTRPLGARELPGLGRSDWLDHSSPRLWRSGRRPHGENSSKTPGRNCGV
jgi:hypothetical protein